MWTEGMIRGHKFYCKHFEEGSEYGIAKGRISKLSIWRDGVEIYNYDRRLDFDFLSSVGDEVLAQILEKYN
jgi:hypothetical protein